MIHKLCENHLTELYDAIRAGKIAEIEKIEHELTSIEECVACAYSLKAEGAVKNDLLGYLASQGFQVEIPKKEGILAKFGFWTIRILVPILPAVILFQILGNYFITPAKFILGFLAFIASFLIIDRVLGD